MEHMDSKRVKINFKSVNGDNFEKLDMSEYYKNIDIQRKKDEERYKIEVSKEKERIKKLACPLCKSKDKTHNLQYISNGILGPGASSSTTSDYYICNKCGIHFSDLNKKKITPIKKYGRF